MAFKVFPLTKGYAFAAAKGLGREVDAIRQLTWKRKTARLHRGKTIRLFQERGLLEEFIDRFWLDGRTRQGQTYMALCLRAADEYEQHNGSGRRGPDGAQPVAEASPPPGPPASPPPVAPPLAIRNQLLERLLLLTPDQFEDFVVKFLKAKGFAEVRSTGHPGDGGIDGECSMPFLKLKVAFQAKRYAVENSIGANPIRNFKGGLIGRYDRGIFITTSTFTPGAREEAEQPGITLVLTDGNELVSQMIQLGLGVETVPVVEQRIDEDFFNNLGS